MNRDPYLDFLRALAIIMVLIHHVSQQWPAHLPWLIQYTHHGAIGVDLFFALSGFLVGGIFWREAQEYSSVNLWRFWSRRWLRTVPPYLAGLALAWGAVFIFRDQKFDAGYLLFLQNYYESIPFFLVSWSLCVEEHFYLFIPLAFFFLAKSKFSVMPALIAMVMLPTLFRFLEFDQASSAFGYYVTASHLNADGLLLGFTVSYLRYFRNWKITPQIRWYSGFAFLSMIIILLFFDVSLLADYIFGRFLVAFTFITLLLVGVDARNTKILGSPLIAFVAITSYSVYLTHALVIHLTTYLFGSLAIGHARLYFAIQLTCIFFIGWLFFRIFELGALRLRDRLVPQLKMSDNYRVPQKS